MARGKAYRCYCTVEELEAERAAAETARRSRIATRAAAACARKRASRSRTTRRTSSAAKSRPGPIEFHDLIRGDVQFEGELIDDFVLIRSDGNPTYHLSVVVDDVDMEITHVARGDDHLSNTPKHIVLFRAFGAEVPVFAHLPLILGSDRKRLSKRTGATSAEEYRDLGIVPAALFNFLTLLGWNPGGDRELISRDEAAQVFDLSDVNKAPAVFDPEKLLWMNGQYLMRMSRRRDLSAPRSRSSASDARPLDELRAVDRVEQDARTHAARAGRADGAVLRRRRLDRVRAGGGEEAPQRRRPRRRA